MALGAALAILLVASCGFLASARPTDTPSFCHGLDCPKYTVLNSTKDYEVRSYPVSYWASTSIEAMNFSYATGVGKCSSCFGEMHLRVMLISSFCWFFFFFVPIHGTPVFLGFWGSPASRSAPSSWRSEWQTCCSFVALAH
jgi:hypothetical protein